VRRSLTADTVFVDTLIRKSSSLKYFRVNV
jgi:hypothetical protein